VTRSGRRPAAPGYVIFDLDDTLIGTRDASLAAWVEVAGRLGIIPPSRRSFDEGYRSWGFRSCFDRWFGPRTTIDFDQFSALYRDAVRYAPIGDIRTLIAELAYHGVPAGIVTNSTEIEAGRKLVSAGIPGRLFDFVAGRPEGRSGPAAKDLGRILTARRIDPATALHISDNPADNAPSVHAGLHFRGVLTGVFSTADFDAGGVPRGDVHPDVHGAIRAALATGDQTSR
jgi:beta-phosphoglucomutase-like phosphatase (HAD superfamily)